MEVYLSAIEQSLDKQITISSFYKPKLFSLKNIIAYNAYVFQNYHDKINVRFQYAFLLVKNEE